MGMVFLATVHRGHILEVDETLPGNRRTCILQGHQVNCVTPAPRPVTRAAYQVLTSNALKIWYSKENKLFPQPPVFGWFSGFPVKRAPTTECNMRGRILDTPERLNK
jgi:hypothetical protein